MNNEFFALLVMGHLVGDFLLQNKWMAMNKSKNTFKCIVHCLLYTLAVWGFTQHIVTSFYWPILIFVSHFPIDRWSLADKWLNLIGARSLPNFLQHGQENVTAEIKMSNSINL